MPAQLYNLTSDLFQKPPDFIPQPASENFQVFPFVPLPVFLQLRQEIQSADPAFDNPGALPDNRNIITHGRRIRLPASASDALSGKLRRAVHPINVGDDFGVSGKEFGFTISWATNFPVVVEACTDLANPIWAPLATNTLINGSAQFSDPAWTNHPARFYRIRSP